MLDGNINPRSWSHDQTNRNGGKFLSTLLRQHSDQGAAKTLDAFLDLCGRAHKAHCAFSARSAAATRDKYDALLRRVRSHPASYDISYADLTSQNWEPSPARDWPPAAECLQDLSENAPLVPVGVAFRAADTRRAARRSRPGCGHRTTVCRPGAVARNHVFGEPQPEPLRLLGA